MIRFFAVRNCSKFENCSKFFRLFFFFFFFESREKIFILGFWIVIVIFSKWFIRNIWKIPNPIVQFVKERLFCVKIGISKSHRRFCMLIYSEIAQNKTDMESYLWKNQFLRWFTGVHQINASSIWILQSKLTLSPKKRSFHKKWKIWKLDTTNQHKRVIFIFAFFLFSIFMHFLHVFYLSK